MILSTFSAYFEQKIPPNDILQSGTDPPPQIWGLVPTLPGSPIGTTLCTVIVPTGQKGLLITSAWPFWSWNCQQPTFWPQTRPIAYRSSPLARFFDLWASVSSQHCTFDTSRLHKRDISSWQIFSLIATRLAGYWLPTPSTHQTGSPLP